jgi:hypothetical protein
MGNRSAVPATIVALVQAFSVPAFPQELQMIPDDEIQVINQLDREINFFRPVDGDWDDQVLKPGDDVIWKARDVAVLIPTGDLQAEGLPPLASLTLQRGVFSVAEKYFLRNLSGGNRWYFCWSPKHQRWAVILRSEDICS